MRKGMRVESAAWCCAGGRVVRMLATGNDDPFVADPHHADVEAGRIDGADRWRGPRDGEGRQEQREAQAPGHAESMTRPGAGALTVIWVGC